MSRMWSQSGALPMRLGTRIAFVLGPIISSIFWTSIWNVSGVTSTNTGTKLARIMGAMSVEKVTDEVMISSPGDRPRTSMAKYNADDPELHMIPRFFPKREATRRSISRTFLPIRSAVGPPRRTLTTASISRSSWTDPAYSMRRVPCVIRVMSCPP